MNEKMNYLKDNGYEENQIVSAGMAGLTIEDAATMIRKEIQQIKHAYLRLGLIMKYVRDNEMYKSDITGEFPNIYEWAKEKFDLSKAVVVRCIEICEQFPIDYEAMELGGRYRDFSYSQIVELLPMNQEQREMVTSDMTVKQIREFWKECKKSTGEKKDSAADGNDPEIAGAESNLKSAAEIPVVESVIQTPLPAFTCDREMKCWLETPEKWGGPWYTDENIGAAYYKYDFENGCRLVAVRYRYSCPMDILDSMEIQQKKELDGTFCGKPHLHLIYSAGYLREHGIGGQKAERYYSNNTVSVKFLIDFLEEIQKEAVDAESEDTVPADTLYEEGVPGQMAISDFMDIGQDDPSLAIDGIISEKGLEDSSVIMDILDILNDQNIDDEMKDERVKALLDSAGANVRQKIEETLKQISVCA